MRYDEVTQAAAKSGPGVARREAMRPVWLGRRGALGRDEMGRGTASYGLTG
jgi:hypothetical protein